MIKALDPIICLNDTHPQTDEFTFNPPGEYVFPFGQVTLIVPCGAKDNYKNATGEWFNLILSKTVKTVE